MKVQVKTPHFQSFGGINFMESDFKDFGFESLITAHLGSRSPVAFYSYSDIVKNIFYMHSIGGEVLDDINTLREQMKDHPDLTVCSADTIEYGSQELKRPNQEILTDKGITHTINVHDGFNRLLPALCKEGKLLNTKKKYTLDYDGHVVENTKRDNAVTYKHSEGYYPVLCSIDKLPVYMENRKGNSPENYRELAVIQKAFEQCDELDIHVKRFRADACCYEKETIAYLESRQIQYYIRADLNESLRIAMEDEIDWQPAKLNYKDVEVCAMEEKVFGENTYRRMVAYRKKATGQLTIYQPDGYEYHAIITSDPGEPLEVIKFYNHRGCEGEHHFKELDYDFGWGKLPFETMEMNTVYMYSTIVGYLLFNIFKHRYALKLSFISPQMRLKNFTLHFVNLVARWIRKSRQWILNIYTQKDYSPIWVT
ncbi:MAG: IS1380 family transposase [Chitinophagaceae bacterium]